MSLNDVSRLMALGLSGGEANAIQDQVCAVGASTPASLGGSSLNTMGDINLQISSAGIQPAATGSDQVLAVTTIPANSFDKAGRGIAIQAQGSFGANGNNKRVKIIFNPTSAVVGQAVVGGTAVCDSGTVTTNGGGWVLNADVFKFGAAGSNTQLGLNTGSIAGTTHLGTTSPVNLTATESAAITVAVTGNATSAVSDIVFNFLQSTWMN